MDCTCEFLNAGEGSSSKGVRAGEWAARDAKNAAEVAYLAATG